MKLILIPGLGYDLQIFKNLNLTTNDIEYLNWIEPKTDENIHGYSQRLFAKIKNTSERITLIGHSLGGIVAQEIASVNTIDKIILISSIKSRKEMPFSFRAIRPLRLDRFFTKELSSKTINIWGKYHGFESNQEKVLFKSMVGKQTNHYLQWALRELSSWKSPKIPSQTKLIQIHGTKDKTFPIKLIKNSNYRIENGSHIFVYKQSDKTSELINNIIKS